MKNMILYNLQFKEDKWFKTKMTSAWFVEHTSGKEVFQFCEIFY